MRGEPVRVQVARYIQEAFINTVYVDVFVADIFHIDREDLRADLFIELHPGRGYDV